MDHDTSTFACGCVANLDMVFCAKELDDLVEKDRENSFFLLMFRGDWFELPIRERLDVGSHGDHQARRQRQVRRGGFARGCLLGSRA